jgi:hypothetical protein
MTNVGSLIEDFANQLAVLVESRALEQARAAIESALGVGRPARPGRPPKAAPLVLAAGLHKKTRKKPPKQFCPVPGCKNVAAPVFGMVCADHKDVAKAKIKKYREARKAKKLGLPPPKAAKPKRRKVAKPRPQKAAKPRTPKAAKPRTQKAAKRKPAKRRPPKVVAPAPVAAAKPPVDVAA